MGEKVLTSEQVDALTALLIAVDEIDGSWHVIERKMCEFGIESPETAFEGLRSLVFS